MTTVKMNSEQAAHLTIAGQFIEYSYFPGRRAGLPVAVFLHEGLGSLALWRDFPTTIARRVGCAVLAYSRGGNGFSNPLTSARTPRYMHDEALLVLPELLAKLGISEVALIGHSDGASIALLYAAAHPDTVRALVLEAPHVFVEGVSLNGIAAAKVQYESGDLRERMMRHHTDANKTFYGWNDVWLAPEFREWNIEAELPRVRAPVLVIQGTADEYGTLAQVEAIASGVRAPLDRLLLSACGHAPHRDRAAFVEDAIVAWLTSLGFWR
jgi:pimeloyl-ACP methyl ester carboxylesterase